MKNKTNLRAFDDDEQILHFIANDDIFKDETIDEDVHDQSMEDISNDSKGKPIPKGVVSLEKLYELMNHFKGPRNNKTLSAYLDSTMIYSHGPTMI